MLKSALKVFHFFLRTFKRALCCLRRRRKPLGEPIPLTNVSVISHTEKAADLQPWGSWEEMPTVITDYSSKTVDPIQQKIEQYREQRMAPPVDGEENVDFFQDMTPKIIKQKKLLLQKKETDDCVTQSSFSLAPDPTFHSSELGVWDDSQSWEDQTEEDWNASEILKEKKRLDREKRLAEQQRKKNEKEVRTGRILIATKIS